MHALQRSHVLAALFVLIALSALTACPVAAGEGEGEGEGDPERSDLEDGWLDFVDADEDGTPDECAINGSGIVQCPEGSSLSDLDGDTIPDDFDLDRDGDGTRDDADDDMDGDSLLNEEDDDLDGDTVLDRADLDLDGDGKSNASDEDIDGDGIPNLEDPDRDGDGVVDPLPGDVPGGGCGGPSNVGLALLLPGCARLRRRRPSS